MNTKDTSICLRLGEERKRLHLSQSKVAQYCNVSVKTIGRWEKNIPVPSDKLALLLDLGYDSTYILSGNKPALRPAGSRATSNTSNAKDNGETESQPVLNSEFD
jgi:transcriptional regulator with XRE-family HTH domain